MKIRTLAATTAMAVAMMVPLGASPVAAGDRDVERSGSCTRNSRWSLKLSPENGRLGVEFEVDQNVNGDTWRVTMKHDGTRFFRGRRVTRAPSGSFEVRQMTGNAAGTDHVTARARNLSTDEVCRGSASF